MWIRLKCSGRVITLTSERSEQVEQAAGENIDFPRVSMNKVNRETYMFHILMKNLLIILIHTFLN